MPPDTSAAGIATSAAGIAKDVGVSSEQIDRAVFMLQEEQQTREKERGLWLRFKAHALVFAGVNLLLVAINLIGGSGTFWALYSIFGWGLFLLGHYAGLRYAPQFVEMATQRTRNMMDMGDHIQVDGDQQCWPVNRALAARPTRPPCQMSRKGIIYTHERFRVRYRQKPSQSREARDRLSGCSGSLERP